MRRVLVGFGSCGYRGQEVPPLAMWRSRHACGVIQSEPKTWEFRGWRCKFSLILKAWGPGVLMDVWEQKRAHLCSSRERVPHSQLLRSIFPHLLIQMLISSQNIFTGKCRDCFYQPSGHPLASQSWPIKLAIKRSPFIVLTDVYV